MMMRSDEELGRSREGFDSGGGSGRSMISRSLSSLLPIDGTVSYRKLSLGLYKLSILKLDGTSFDVEIASNAKVSDLKEAIEEVFSLSADGSEEQVSWSHVWGHFCLCYEGQKLLSDKAYLRNFGIEDGDQLEFIKHITLDRYSKKKRPKDVTAACKQYHLLPSGPLCGGNDTGDQEEYPMPEFRFAAFLRGWLPSSQAWSMGRRGSEGGSSRLRSSIFSVQCLGMLGSRPSTIRLGA